MIKRILIAIKVMFFILLFYAGCQILNYIYVTPDEWNRILFHSYYSQERNIDNVFLGSSLVYCGIKPEILDDLNGQNNFNMSTPGQRWNNTLELLTLVQREHKIKHVYLECYCGYNSYFGPWNTGSSSYESADPIDNSSRDAMSWQISYYLNPSIMSFIIHWHVAKMDNLMEAVFPFARFHGNISDYQEICTNIALKKSYDYRNYIYAQTSVDKEGNKFQVKYFPKGRYYSDKKIIDVNKSCSASRYYGMGDKSSNTMKKALAYCRKNDIPVTLFVSPLSDLWLLSTGDYDTYCSDLKKFADENDVDVYDFNLIKNRYMDIKDDNYYFDTHHMNDSGASVFTPVFWDVVSHSAEENSDKFYDSYKEKLREGDFKLFGLYYENGAPENDTKIYHIASNRDGEAEYKISRTVETTEEGSTDTKIIKTELLQEFDKNGTFELPSEDHGKITINAHYQGESTSITVGY